MNFGIDVEWKFVRVGSDPETSSPDYACVFTSTESTVGFLSYSPEVFQGVCFANKKHVHFEKPTPLFLKLVVALENDLVSFPGELHSLMQCDNLEMACETAFLNGLPITIESLSGDQFLLGLISEISNDGIKLDWIDGDGTLGTNLDWITYTEIDILTVAGAYETLVNRACR